MDIDAVYEEIASGASEATDLSWTRRRLQAMALARAKEGTDEQRLGALRVAAVLGPKDGIPIVTELVRDRNAQVRTWAVHQAIAARELGIGPLRGALDGPDPAQVRVALEHLLAWVDSGCVPALRRVLASPDAGVRARAAALLGNVGGPAVRGELERLKGDPSDEVRAVAAVALEVLAGVRPKAVRTPWWDPTDVPTTEVPTAEIPTAEVAGPITAPVALPPAEPTTAPLLPVSEPTETVTHTGSASAPTDGAITRRDRSAPPTWGADAKPLVAAPPERARATPKAAEPEAAWDGRAAALPHPLPQETRALIKLLGMVAEPDRPQVIACFQAADAGKRKEEFSKLLLAYAGADAALGRGLCLLAAVLGGPAHVTAVRPLLRDPNPVVKDAALYALGAIAGPAAVPWITPFLADPDRGVRLAAVAALGALGRRVRPDLVRDVVSRLKTDDAELKQAIATALGGLAP